MDTRFWGPSGWKLLHAVTFSMNSRPTTQQQKRYQLLFESLKYVLPCRFCRESYKQFVNIRPIDTSTRERLSRWLYDIHNLVNDKLRNQGYIHEPNPSWKEVKEYYGRCQGKPITCGWDFLFSIAMNYPVENVTNRHLHHWTKVFFEQVCYFTQMPCTNIPHIVFHSRLNLVEYVYDIYSTTMKSIGPTCVCYAKNTVLEHVERYRSQTCKRKTAKTCRTKKKQYKYIDQHLWDSLFKHVVV